MGAGGGVTANLWRCMFNRSVLKHKSNHLNTRLVQHSNGRFVPGCQMVRYSNDGLKTGLKKPFYGPKCLVIK